MSLPVSALYERACDCVSVCVCVCLYETLVPPLRPSHSTTNALVTIVSVFKNKGKALVVMATAMLHRAQDEERNGEVEVLYFGLHSLFHFYC